MFFVHEDVFNIKVYKSMGDLIPILIFFFVCFVTIPLYQRNEKRRVSVGTTTKGKHRCHSSLVEKGFSGIYVYTLPIKLSTKFNYWQQNVNDLEFLDQTT